MTTNMAQVNPLAIAISRRDAALAEVRKWEDFIKTFEELTGGTPQPPVREITPMLPGIAESRPVPVNPRIDFSGAALAMTEQRAVQLITEAGRPMHTRELLRLMEAGGMPIGGKNAIATLSARLSRAKSLWNTRIDGWAIRDEVPERDEAEGGTPGGEPSASDATQHSADSPPGGGT